MFNHKPGKSLAVHPFLFAAFPTISLFSHNIRSTPSAEILMPVTFSIAVALSVYFLSFLFCKNNRKAAMATSFLIFLFFSYGHAYGVLIRPGTAEKSINLDLLLLPFWLIIFVTGTYFIFKTSRGLFGLTKILNAMAVFLLCYSGAKIGMYHIKEHGRSDWKHNKQIATTRLLSLNEKSNRDFPDIYYIILC